LENKLESLAPSQGTTGKILASSTATEVLKFIVGKLPQELGKEVDYSGGVNNIYGHPTPGNNAAALKKLQTQKMVAFPIRPKPTVKRKFMFGTSNGA